MNRTQPPAEAVIVAGGFGSRMQPLTERRPKHLLDVGGVPFLEHQLARLASAGVQHVVLATSYHAEAFAPVLGDGSRWGIRLDYVREDQPLGTAGAIRNAAGALGTHPGGAVVVLNGDILSDHDIGDQLADFEVPRGSRRVEVSLHLVRVADATAYGCVPTDGLGRVVGFEEKSPSPVTDQVNAGCYVFRREVIDLIPTGRQVSVERETFPALVAAEHLVVGHLVSGYWRDVGDPHALVAASKDLVLGVATSPAVEAQPSGACVDARAGVASSAAVNGGSVVAAGASVGSRAHVSGSVLMAGSAVGDDAVVVDSVLGPGAVVGSHAHLLAAALGDDARAGAGVRLEGARVPCGAQV